MRRFKTLSWALWVSLALTGERAGDALHARDARAPSEVRATGEHVVRASMGATGGELRLKNGFALRAHLRDERMLPVVLALRVAERRARADEIAPGFVPIGPTVELDRALGRSDIAFLAEAFRVRAGHRLVLAVERACGPRGSGSCWTLRDAEYRESRCAARAVATGGLRLQFGSVPVPTDEATRSAAR